MSAPKIITVICVTCDDEFKFEYKGGRKPVTCSDSCKKIRAKKSKRVKRKEVKVGEPEYPINHRRPNISDTDTYRAMTATKLKEYTAQSIEIWEHKRLRGTSPDVDMAGWQIKAYQDAPNSGPKVHRDADGPWIMQGQVNDLPGFVMDDHFDVQGNPLALIAQNKRAEVDHWLKKNRFKAGWDVGQTAKGYLPVLGSTTRAATNAITPEQYRRHFGSPSERPTGALKPFVWNTDETAPEVVVIHAWGVPLKVAA